MKKVRFAATILLILVFAVSFSGCTLVVGQERVYFYERPAIGFTVEEETVTDVELQNQNHLSLSALDGRISILPADGDRLQIIEKRRLTGPASRKALKALLQKEKLEIEKDEWKLEITSNPEEEQKPFFRLVTDMELRIPKKLVLLDIEAKSGGIDVSGIEGASRLKLTIGKGGIKADDCEAYQLAVSITNGNLEISNCIGNGNYQCGRGNILLQNTTGNIELSSLAGDTVIEGAEGRLDCEVATGSLTIGSSLIKKESLLYTSNGTITADMTNLEPSGKYAIKASKGDVRLKLSEKAGWSLLAESTKGKIADQRGHPGDGLKKAPTGEVYGDVRDGGPTIDVYVDMGDIILQ